eukprot:gnl/TRDRNA2_/TRDRNA2_138204_c2_seq3.p1 gnl/TRDRNA2_/TRDRNA2_138204_c2~~gnl/TRDRNA2_/TRDRNA2_138204_c2_seq3.p1  ORF type:complete len:334 (+),score=55.72 gnl/TRDRNA2_/TRDRNA2_138204_c2_seq3:52-1002(+)
MAAATKKRPGQPMDDDHRADTEYSGRRVRQRKVGVQGARAGSEGRSDALKAISSMLSKSWMRATRKKMTFCVAASKKGSGGSSSSTTGPSPPSQCEEKDCAICFESLESKGGAVKVPCDCQVSYCSDCWDRALAESTNATGEARCPSCRALTEVEYHPTADRMVFTRAPADGLSRDWQDRLYELARPKQVELLRCHGADEAAPRCVCGGQLRCVSIRDRVISFLASRDDALPRSAAVVDWLMLTPPVVCDICEQGIPPGSRVWECEKGPRTILHARSYDVCETCFSHHTLGIPPPPPPPPLTPPPCPDDEDSEVED